MLGKIQLYHKKVKNKRAPYILWSGVLEWSFGVEYWCGLESNFEVAKILITPADSV